MKKQEAFTVAVDGPGAAGKGTVARAIAEHFEFPYLDTGLLYRVVAKKLLTMNIKNRVTDPIDIARNLLPADLHDGCLRNPEISIEASRIAAIPDVRSVLKNYQRQFARQPGGAVLDGRDIGTVICPEAECKLFITADENVRALRRHKELDMMGVDASLEAVMSELHQRDQRDIDRDCAALRVSDDAVLIDTTDLTIGEAINRAIKTVELRYQFD